MTILNTYTRNKAILIINLLKRSPLILNEGKRTIKILYNMHLKGLFETIYEFMIMIKWMYGF
jgi:hypothetical protein